MFTRAMLAGITAATLIGSGSASAYERWVEVVNQGNSAIWSVHIANIDVPYWPEEDLLGQYVISPGASMVVEPYYHGGYCRFDILITYETGREVVFWDVNLCEATALYSSDSGYTDISY